MDRQYGVSVDATALSAEALAALARRLANEPDVAWGAEQLAAQLARGPLRLLAHADRARAQAIHAVVVAAGGSAELIQTSTQYGAGDAPEPGDTLQRGTAPDRGADARLLGATMMGGFGLPRGGGSLPLLARAPARLDALESMASDSDLVLLDGEGSGSPGRSQPPPQAFDSTLPLGAPLPSGASRASAVELDSLDASALVMLDGSADDAPPPERETTERRTAAAVESTGSRAHANDPRFRPPDAPGEASRAESLDVELPVVASTSPRVAPDEEPAADTEMIAERVEEAAPVEAQGEADRRPGLAPSRTVVSGSARRRRLSLGLASTLKRNAHLRVVLGFGLALGLGAIIPMCHARSVMSTTVAQLRVELATAKAHGVHATPTFGSVDQIQDKISSVKARQGAFTFFLWLAGAGSLLFLWFRFL